MFRPLLVTPVFLIACFFSGPCYNTAAGAGDPEVTLIYPPPNVSITYCPAIRLLATATSRDATIEKVDFFVSSNLIGTATAAPYLVNWNGCPGTDMGKIYTLRAVASDTLGRSNEATVPVYVTQDPGPARFSITSPTNGLVVAAPATVKLSAVLTHTDGRDSPLGFYLGTNLVGQVTQPPYELTISNLSIGDYTFRLGVTNEFGIVDVSPRVNFRVGTFTDNPPSVRITNLASNNGFVAPATIRIRAEVNDADGPVASVQFFECCSLGGSNLIATVTMPPFEVVWTNASARLTGFVSAIATDELGLGAQNAVGLSIAQPLEAPSASITQPQPDSYFPTASPVTIQAEITTDNNLNPVEFFSGTNFLGSVSDWPYLLTVTNLGKGIHFLSVRQQTLSNKSARSTPLVIIVGALGLVESNFSRDGFQADVLGNFQGAQPIIQASTNLLIWSPISPVFLPLSNGTNEFFQFIDRDSTNYPFRFYRALLPQ